MAGPMWPTAWKLLHFKDTNGDGKADATRVVLFGVRHRRYATHILHTLRWGHDGMPLF